MYIVYILYSEYLDRYYVGQTQNIDDRLQRHNGKRSKATKAGVPWKLVYIEKYVTRKEAVQRERIIKKQKSKKFIKNLVDQSNNAGV